MSFVFDVGENFRHLAKISSLFPDEFFPDKVYNLEEDWSLYKLFRTAKISATNLNIQLTSVNSNLVGNEK